jgi:hypothetical protein
MTPEPELKYQLECAFQAVGQNIGEMVRCMVQAEIATHMARIQQLQSVLSGTTCAPTDSVIAGGDTPAS